MVFNDLKSYQQTLIWLFFLFILFINFNQIIHDKNYHG